MARTKRVSPSAVEEAKKENAACVTESVLLSEAILSKQNYGAVKGEYLGNIINITKHINVQDMMSFVNKTVDACFSEDGDYKPEKRDFAIRLATLIAYTDIDTNIDVNKQYELCYCDGLIDMVHNNIDKNQFSDMMNAINEKIAYRSSMNIQFLYRQINEVTSSFAAMIEKFEGVFNGIGIDDLESLISAVGKMDLNEEKLMRAYIKETKNNQ